MPSGANKCPMGFLISQCTIRRCGQVILIPCTTHCIITHASYNQCTFRIKQRLLHDDGRSRVSPLLNATLCPECPSHLIIPLGWNG